MVAFDNLENYWVNRMTDNKLRKLERRMNQSSTPENRFAYYSAMHRAGELKNLECQLNLMNAMREVGELNTREHFSSVYRQNPVLAGELIEAYGEGILDLQNEHQFPVWLLCYSLGRSIDHARTAVGSGIDACILFEQVPTTTDVKENYSPFSVEELGCRVRYRELNSTPEEYCADVAMGNTCVRLVRMDPAVLPTFFADAIAGTWGRLFRG